MGSKIGFVSLGCSKNLVDTEAMLGLLTAAGHEVEIFENEADVIIVNTCTFIEKAQSEAIETIIEMAQNKSGKCRGLIVAGCLAQRYGQQVLDQLPEVDAVIGTHSYHRIVEVVERVLKGERFVLCDSLESPVPTGLPRVQTTPKHYAYLKIADGCNHHCTYCVIPSVRGPVQSRPVDELLTEAKKLFADGVKELIVVAQDPTQYGVDLGKEGLLCQLLEQLCTVGFPWIRLHYLYPECIDDTLLAVMQKHPQILPYFDIPIQHANDRILGRMGRKTKKEALTALFNKIRKQLPDAVLRTSLIVGFPGETEAEFEELCEYVKETRFDHVGVFTYSQEEDTPAASFPNQVEESVKEKRQELLMDLQAGISAECLSKRVGTTLTVLIEDYDFDNKLYFGRSYADSPDIDGMVYFSAKETYRAGDFAEVHITDCLEYDLLGEA